jgi:hypothetical protein
MQRHGDGLDENQKIRVERNGKMPEMQRKTAGRVQSDKTMNGFPRLTIKKEYRGIAVGLIAYFTLVLSIIFLLIDFKVTGIVLLFVGIGVWLISLAMRFKLINK